MRKLLTFVCVFLCVLCGCSEPLPADDILAFVRTKLPDDPLKLTGSLKVKARNGFTKSSQPVVMELNWGAAAPTAHYQIGKESLTITWKNNVPAYRFSKDNNKPTDEILGTGITWADLSFSVLWWPGSRLIDEAKKINRDCYIVDVPIPGSDETMRLWIEKKMGMLLESQTLDAKMKQLRRMKIKSVKKMEGMWVAKDLEIKDFKTGIKTTLQISDLEWKEPKPTAAAFDAAEAVNRLAYDLYNQVSGESKDNLFLSPYSISSALAMVYGGARSETEGQIKTTLHFGGQGATHPAFSYLRNKLTGIQQKNGVQLSVANSLWPQEDYTFLPDYLALTKEFYGTAVESVDYKDDTEAARVRINKWVEARTMNRIQNLITEGMLDKATRLVLANAIYFKGSWATGFKKEETRDLPFHTAPDTSLKVPTMTQTADLNLAFSETFQALELPYKGGDLSMVILLPQDAKGLGALEQTLSPERLAGLQFSKREVFVQLPKFKIEWKSELNSTLSDMGMPLAFSDHADLSGMDGSKSLSVGFVVHQAFVEVNEEGTEAAAATAGGITLTSMPPQFIANHPFLFLIRENSTGTILFIGRVMDPSK